MESSATFRRCSAGREYAALGGVSIFFLNFGAILLLTAGAVR